MTDEPSSGELSVLYHLHRRCRTIPTGSIHGPTLAALLARGYVEVTWAGRVRLTDAGADLFEVVVA